MNILQLREIIPRLKKAFDSPTIRVEVDEETQILWFNIHTPLSVDAAVQTMHDVEKNWWLDVIDHNPKIGLTLTFFRNSLLTELFARLGLDDDAVKPSTSALTPEELARLFEDDED